MPKRLAPCRQTDVRFSVNSGIQETSRFAEPQILGRTVASTEVTCCTDHPHSVGSPKMRPRSSEDTPPSVADRQSANPIPLVLNNDNRPAGQLLRAVVDDAKQPQIYGSWRLIPQTEHDDTRSFAARRSQNLSEVKIEGEDDPRLSPCFRDDLGVGKTNEASSRRCTASCWAARNASTVEIDTPMSARNLTRQDF